MSKRIRRAMKRAITNTLKKSSNLQSILAAKDARIAELERQLRLKELEIKTNNEIHARQLERFTKKAAQGEVSATELMNLQKEFVKMQKQLTLPQGAFSIYIPMFDGKRRAACYSANRICMKHPEFSKYASYPSVIERILDAIYEDYTQYHNTHKGQENFYDVHGQDFVDENLYEALCDRLDYVIAHHASENGN